MSFRSLQDVRVGAVASQNMHFTRPTCVLASRTSGDRVQLGVLILVESAGMGQDIGSQQLLPSAIAPRWATIASVPVCHCSATELCIRQPILATLRSVMLRAARSRFGFLSTDFFAILACSDQTTDQPAEPAHNLFERPIFLFQQLPLVFEACQFLLYRVSRCSICTVSRQPCRPASATADQGMWKRKPWRMSVASPKSSQSSRWPEPSARQRPSQDPAGSPWKTCNSDCGHALGQMVPCKAASRPDNLRCLCAVARTARATCPGFMYDDTTTSVQSEIVGCGRHVASHFFRSHSRRKRHEGF